MKKQADSKLQQKSSLSDEAKFRSDLTKFNFSAANLRAVQMNANAFRGGSEGTGGGDALCAGQVDRILHRFGDWFKNDGPRNKGIDIEHVAELPDLTYDQLNKAVAPWLVEGAIVPVCINPRFIKYYPNAYTDETKHFSDLLTKYNKVCFYVPTTNGKDPQGKEIARYSVVCDSTIMKTLASGDKSTAGDEFEQIGHELLGIAQIENRGNKNDLQVSSNPISKQFRSFLNEFIDFQLDAESEETTAEVVNSGLGDSSFALKLKGGKGSAAEEIFHDLKSKYEVARSSAPKVNCSNLGS